MKPIADFVRPALALVFLFVAIAVAGAADATSVKVVGADSRAYSRNPTNMWIARDVQSKVYDITVNNVGATDLYVFIFDSNTNMVNGDYPSYTAAKVTAGTDRSYFFTGGCVFTNGLVIATSTTPTTLTNSSATFTIGISYDRNIR